MPQSVLERTNEQITETFGKAARATVNAGNALHERFDDAKVFARRGAHRAEEYLDQGQTHIKRHPVAAVTVSFALGLGLGVLLGWTMRRK